MSLRTALESRGYRLTCKGGVWEVVNERGVPVPVRHSLRLDSTLEQKHYVCVYALRAIQTLDAACSRNDININYLLENNPWYITKRFGDNMNYKHEMDTLAELGYSLITNGDSWYVTGKDFIQLPITPGSVAPNMTPGSPENMAVLALKLIRSVSESDATLFGDALPHYFPWYLGTEPSYVRKIIALGYQMHPSLKAKGSSRVIGAYKWTVLGQNGKDVPIENARALSKDEIAKQVYNMHKALDVKPDWYVERKTDPAEPSLNARAASVLDSLDVDTDKGRMAAQVALQRQLRETQHALMALDLIECLKQLQAGVVTTSEALNFMKDRSSTLPVLQAGDVDYLTGLPYKP